MDYPDPYGLSFIDHDSIRIVDITALLPTHAVKTFRTRKDWAIRKILIHQHAGAAKSTVDKRADGVPKGCKSTADFVTRPNDPAKKGVNGKDKAGYGYNYDIGYGEDRSAGKDLVYQTQFLNKISHHTGDGQNEMGVAVSHMGYMRHLDAPTGAPYSPNDGKPHDAQKRVLPQMVDYLQQKFGISDLHVEGHFQHKKAACPGWDIEYWLMQRELRPGLEGRGFCWPIDLPEFSSPPFLVDSADVTRDARRLVANNKQGGTGFFPFGRRALWHDGIHLFPPGGEGANVYAVRDGWVVGARVEKNVVLDGKDYGSASFVLVMHEDPGLYDPFDNRTSGSKRRPYPPTYHSLSMHLMPLDDSIGWVAMLKDRDRTRYDELFASPGTGRNLSGVGLPVKAGEIIGKVGQHNPFAARHPDLDAADDTVFDTQRHSVLHFEMFFRDNLIKRFDPDDKLHQTITIRDTDTDSIADDIVRKLRRISGFSDDSLTELQAAITEADTADPGFQDASAWSAALGDSLNNALSQVVAEHRSEWHANWNRVINARYKDWGLSIAERDHFREVISQFQWWSEVVRNEAGYRFKFTGLTPDTRPFYANPIRLLCWLHGLSRELDHEITGGHDASGYPISTNINADLWILTTVRAKARKGDTSIQLRSSLDEDRFDGSSFRIKKHAKVYEISSFTASRSGKKVTSYDITFSPALEDDIRKGTQIKLGNYGWHFEQSFDWDTDLSGG